MTVVCQDAEKVFQPVQGKVEVQVQRITTPTSALTSSLACSVLLAAALLDSLFQHPEGIPAVTPHTQF
jgi:hypothetical protein